MVGFLINSLSFLIAANAIVLVSAALILCDLFVWRKSPRYLGEVLMGLSVVALFCLLKSYGL